MVTTGQAFELRPGDYWSWFGQGGVKVETTELTVDGRLQIGGWIVAHHGRGERATWTVPLTDWVEYERDS